MDETGVLEVLRDRRVAILHLRREKARNALNAELLGRLHEAADAIAGDDEVGAVLVRASGPVFSAGADLVEVAALTPDAPAFHRWLQGMRDALLALERLPQPVVVAVQGTVMAGGLELVLACDVVIASETARLGDGHIRYGFVPGGGGSQRLVRAVGTRMARWLMYTGELLVAEEARSIGLVQHVLPAEGFDDAVLAIVGGIAERSGAALAFMKRLTRDPAVTEDALDWEIAEALRTIGGPEAREGQAAFLEKREPVFR